MTETVLIAYATKYGATAEIAEALAEAIRAVGLTVVVESAETVRDVGQYGAVVVGSAVYMGQWRKEAKEFLARHEAALKQRPVWLFSSGPTGEGDPQVLLKGWQLPDDVLKVAERIAPREIVVFHGDMATDKLNMMEKFIIKRVGAPTGDFRDWDTIRAWGAAIAGAVRATVA